jgi:hypothetical protein
MTTGKTNRKTNHVFDTFGMFGILILIAFMLIFLLSAYFLFSFATTSSKVEINDKKKTISTQGNIYIGESKKGGEFGRGVFANKPFKKGDILERGPLLVGDNSEIFCGLYKKYAWGYDGNLVLPLGYASICNHDDDNNADVMFHEDTYELIALKDIKKDEEIFDTYCKTKTKQECEDWFSEKEIEKL